MTSQSSTKDPAFWIGDGQKFAVIALRVRIDEPESFQNITLYHWALINNQFDIPAHWREWLGTIRTEEIQRSNLLLLSKISSQAPEIDDSETAALMQHVWQFYTGLLLAIPFATEQKPVMLAGYRQNGEVQVKKQQDYDCVIPSMVVPFPPVTLAMLKLAARIASQIATIPTQALEGGHWRLFRVLALYVKARTIPDIMDRLHQYCRCIEGLIVSEPGKGAQRFKSRTELFIGPGHHDMMGEAYRVRSDVEHLHENKHLEVFNRDARLELVKKLEMMEYIARTALTRILCESKLWSYFGNTTALTEFWKCPEDTRRSLWGDPIDPTVAVADFDPSLITDHQLGDS